MTNPDQLVAAWQIAQPVERLIDRSVCEVDPTDHPGDKGRGRGDAQKLFCLAGRRAALHQNAGIDAVRAKQWREIGWSEGAADRRELGRVHPGIFGPCRVPEMLMAVDHHVTLHQAAAPAHRPVFARAALAKTGEVPVPPPWR